MNRRGWMWLLTCVLATACGGSPADERPAGSGLAQPPPVAVRAATDVAPPPPEPLVVASVIASRGQLTATIPLPALPVRAGFDPGLALAYDGSATDLGGGFGVGFSLGVPAIVASDEVGLTLPRGTGADPLVTPLSYQGQRLIFVRTLDGPEPKVVQYRPEISELPTRVYYHRAPTTLRVLGGERRFQGLLVVHADGRQEAYSEDPGSAEHDTFEASGGRKVAVTTRYPLRYQIAPSGDVIEYEYEKVAADQRTYLKSVQFAGGRSRYDFARAELTDAPDRPVFDHGFEQRQTTLYTAVTGRFDGRVVSRTFFVYRTSNGVSAALFSAPEVAEVAAREFGAVLGGAAPLAEERVLVGVLRYGGGDGALDTTARRPPLRLWYAERTLADLQAQTQVTAVDVAGVAGFGAGEGGEFLDVDQDGLLDVVATDPRGTAAALYLNTGGVGKGLFRRAARDLTVSGPSGPVVPDFVGGRTSVWLPGDFDGDGFGDLLQIAPGIDPNESQLSLYPGRLAGGEPFAPTRRSVALKRPLAAFAEGRAQVADLNADGRDDLLIAERKDGAWRFSVLLNLTKSVGQPDGGQLALRDLDGRFEAPALFRDAALAARDLSLSASEIRLADVNGDGLIDLTVVQGSDAGDKGLCVFENRGALRVNVDSAAGPVAKNFVLFGDGSSADATCPGGKFVAIPALSSVSTVHAIWQIDVTGDGLADLVNVDERADQLRVWAFRGREGFRYLGALSLERPLRVDAENRWNTRVLDIDGDGQDEIVVYEGGTQQVLSVVDFNRAGDKSLLQPLLLTGIDEGQGHRQLFQWTTSTDELLRDRGHQRADARGLPFVVPLVKRVLRQQAHAPTAVTEYRYHGAVVNPIERNLLGFSEIEVVRYGDASADGSLSRLAYDPADDRLRARALADRARERVTFAVHADEAARRLLAGLDAAPRAGPTSAAFWSQTSESRTEKPLSAGARLAASLTTWETDVPPTGARPPLYVRVARAVQAQYGAGCEAASCAAAVQTRSYEVDACNRPTLEESIDEAFAGPRGVAVPRRSERISIAYEHVCDAAVLEQTAAPTAFTALRQATRRAPSGRVLTDVQLAYDPKSPFVPSRISTTASLDRQRVPAKIQNALPAAPTRVQQFGYDAYLNVVSVADGDGPIAQITFDDAGVRIVAQANGLGHVFRYRYAPGFLGPTEIATPRGDLVKVGYDALQRLRSTEQADGAQTTYEIREADATATRRVRVRRARSARVQTETLFITRADGLPLAELAPGEADDARVSGSLTYGRLGAPVRSVGPFVVGASAAAAAFEAGDDAAWRPADAGECGDGRVACLRYDALGRITASDAASGRYHELTRHEAWGRTTEVRDEAGARARTTVARDDSVFAVVDEEDHLHRFERDEADQLAGIRLAGEESVRPVVSDSLGRVWYSALPGGMSKVFAHDARGRLVREAIFDRALEPGGHAQTRYDLLDRPIARDTHGGLPAVALDKVRWIYDHQEGGSAADVGSVVQTLAEDLLAGSSFEEWFRHDADGRITARRATYRAGSTVRSYEEAWTYALDGLQTSYTDPFANRFDYGLTASGQVASIGWTGRTAGGVLAAATSFDALGRATTLARPLHRLSEQVRYDTASGDLLARRVCDPEARTCLKDDVWARRGDGRVTALRGLGGEAVELGYTARGALLSAKHGARADRYELDAAGHWRTCSECGTTPFTRGEGAPALPDGFSADTFGRLTRGGAITSVLYDPDGRLRRVALGDTAIVYAYGADGKRVARQKLGTDDLTVYPTPRTRDDGRQRQSLITVDAQPLAVVIDETASFALLHDQRGVVEGLVAADGSQAASWRFSPYGTLRAGAPTEVAGFASLELVRSFTGTLRDDDTGLVHMGARTYHPAIASFTTPDPLFLANPGLCTTRTLECGAYGYAASDPVNFVDPDGTMARRNNHRKAAKQRARPAAREADRAAAASPEPSGPTVTRIDPATIRFTQDSINRVFKNGTSVSEVIDGLRAGTIDPSGFPPIRVFERDGSLVTLDNRRLFVFQQAGIAIQTVRATAAEIQSEQFKNTSTNGGTSIRVRGGL